MNSIMEGEPMLYVEDPSTQSGTCPHKYILDRFQAVFDLQREEGKSILYDLDESKKTIVRTYVQVIYHVKGKGIIRVYGNTKQEGKVPLYPDGPWRSPHWFKDGTGLEWQRNSFDYYDPVSKMFTNSLCLAYLMYFWDDVRKKPRHIREINKFLMAHSEKPVPEPSF